MKILSIGNSFSEDAQHYLHSISVAAEKEIECTNLFVGGCSLEQHFAFLSQKESYTLFKNGINMNTKTDAITALKSEKWDYVTLQQVSNSAAHYETYMPYVQALADVVREYASEAKILLHQTWAYEAGSQKLYEKAKFDSPEKMYEEIESTYILASRQINADGIIPCGSAMLYAAKEGVRVHRDCSHASWGIGRYLLGLTWYSYLTGSIAEYVPVELDEAVSKRDTESAVEAVNRAVFGNK